MYAKVFQRGARARGRRSHPDVRCFIQCGSQEVRKYCRGAGLRRGVRRRWARTFIEPAAARASRPGRERPPADEVTISAINRNFPGRTGPGQLYLASPYTVAASAIAGQIVEWVPGRPIAQRESAEPVGV